MSPSQANAPDWEVTGRRQDGRRNEHPKPTTSARTLQGEVTLEGDFLDALDLAGKGVEIPRELDGVIAHGWWDDATDRELADWTRSTVADVKRARQAYRQRVIPPEAHRLAERIAAENGLDAGIGDVILDALRVYGIALDSQRRETKLRTAQRLRQLYQAHVAREEAA